MQTQDSGSFSISNNTLPTSMKNVQLLLAALFLIGLPSCTNLNNNLKNISAYRTAHGDVVSRPDLRIGLVVANKITWEGTSYKHSQLDGMMESQLSSQLAPYFKSVQPYTGTEETDVIIHLNVTHAFSENLVGGNAVTGVAALWLTEYASLGFYCVAVMELTSEANAQAISDTQAILSSASRHRFAKKYVGINAWSMFATGNYGINNSLVTLLTENSVVLTQSIDAAIRQLPASVKGQVNTPSAAPAPRVRRSHPVKVERPTDSLPDFSTVRPKG